MMATGMVGAQGKKKHEKPRIRREKTLVGRPATNSAGAPTNRREKTKPGSIVQGRDWKLPSSEIGHSKPPRADR